MKAKRQLATLFVLLFLLLVGYVALALGSNPQVLLADKATLNQEAIENALTDTQNESVTVRFMTIPSAQITPTVAFTSYLPIVMKLELAPQPLDCDFYEPNDTSEQANWIQGGETQRHCIIPETDIDWVKFSVSTEVEVVIETSGESGDTRMWLYDENLNQIGYDDDGGAGAFSRILQTCPVTGTYYVKVDEFSNNQEIASYDITLTVKAYVCGWDTYEPDNTPEQATWIQSGEIQVHSIGPETDIDWVKFSVITESQVVLETSGESGDTVLRLYDSDLNQLEVDDDGGAGSFSRIDRPCGTGQDFLPAGIYYARVEEWLNDAVIPSYDLALSINACPSAVVLTNHSVYTTSSSLIVVGEIQNNGLIGIKEPRVVVNLFNDSDQLIDTAIAYTHLAQYSWRDSALGAGDKTCSRAEFSEFDGWSYYEFETPTYSSTGDPLQNMTVYGDNGTYDSNDGSYRILGFVRNDDDVTVTDVDLIGTLYDASSTVVGCDITSANNDNLAPGQSSSFELTFSGYYRDYADVDSYRLQVDGISQ